MPWETMTTHGRNTTLQEFPAIRIALTPRYDFAPMLRESGGGVRKTKWDRATTGGSRLDWRKIAQAACGTDFGRIA